MILCLQEMAGLALNYGEYAGKFSDSCKPGLAICGMKAKIKNKPIKKIVFLDKVAMTDIVFICCHNSTHNPGIYYYPHFFCGG